MKLDSDLAPELSSRLRVEGLPTVCAPGSGPAACHPHPHPHPHPNPNPNPGSIFMRGGQEVYRLEGMPAQDGALEALTASGSTRPRAVDTAASRYREALAARAACSVRGVRSTASVARELRRGLERAALAPRSPGTRRPTARLHGQKYCVLSVTQMRIPRRLYTSTVSSKSRTTIATDTTHGSQTLTQNSGRAPTELRRGRPLDRALPLGVGEGALVLIGRARAPAPLLAVGAWADAVLGGVGRPQRRQTLRLICCVGELLLQVSLRLTHCVEDPLLLHELASLLVRYFGHGAHWERRGVPGRSCAGWRRAGVRAARTAPCRGGAFIIKPKKATV
eukprot:scaffold100721_cov69-Phaeocystis_antarctica.AAC.2